MNFIDSIIGYVAPQSGLDRVIARKKLERAYAGATRGRRGQNWESSRLSADAEIAVALPILQDRSRELIRNNAYASRAMQVIQANVIGKGIQPAIMHKDQAFEDKIKKEWQQWAGTTACDFDGRHNFYGLQSLCMRAQAESGEVLIRRRWVKVRGKLVLKLQVLESDFLVTEQNSAFVKGKSLNDNRIIQGIEYSKKGHIVAYHVFKEHPYNLALDSFWKSSITTVRIPAEDIIHLYRADRPSQSRGVPWLTAVMQRLKDFDDYEQAQLLRQKLAACFMAFVTDLDGDPDEKDLEIFSKLEPAAIQFLPAGKQITLSDPPQVNENYADYTRVMLQAVATGIGISYEAMTGNLKDINFSSSRMGWLEFQRNIEIWRSAINTTLNDKAFDWFSDWKSIMGMNMDKVEKSWTAPRREMIDPAKEVPALVDAVNNGMKTLSEVIRENGKVPEDHFKELKAEREMLDKMGLTFQTDNSQENSIAVPKKDDNLSKTNSKN